MKNRTIQLTQIRPKLELAIATTAIEQFQNDTLRPILKFQNPIILQIFRQYIQKRKNTFQRMDTVDQKRYIDHAIKTDMRFKNLLLGMTIGHFTEVELAFYQANQSEINRRVASLLIQRLQSQVEELI